MKIPLVFTDLEALEKEFNTNFKNSMVTFSSQENLTRGQTVTVELLFGSMPLAALEVGIMYAKDGQYGAQIVNLSPNLLAEVTAKLEMIRKDFSTMGQTAAARTQAEEAKSSPEENAGPTQPAKAEQKSQVAAPQSQRMSSQAEGSATETETETKTETKTESGVVKDPAAETKTASDPTEGAEASAGAGTPQFFKIETISPQAKKTRPEPTVSGNMVQGELAAQMGLESTIDENAVREALMGGGSGAPKLGFHQLLLAIHWLELSGHLRVKFGERSKEFIFLAGQPITASIKPKLKEEYLPMVLFRLGLIDPAQYKVANEERKKTTKKFGQILIEQGVMNEDQLRHGLEMQTTVFFQDIFTAEAASFSWTAGEPSDIPAEPLQARPMGIIFRGLLLMLEKHYHFSDLQKLIEDKRNKYPLRVDEINAPLLQMEDKVEKLWTTVINGHRNMRDVFESSTFPRPHTTRVMVAWQMLRALKFIDNPLSDIEQRGKELHRLLDNIDQINYFDLLHVHWTSPEHYYETAFKKQAKRLGPTGEFGQASEYAKNIATKVRQKVEEAGKILTNKESRMAFRLSTFGEDKCRFASDMKTKKGHLAIYKGDIQEGYECYLSAVELNTKNMEAKNGLVEAKKRGGRTPSN